MTIPKDLPQSSQSSCAFEGSFPLISWPSWLYSSSFLPPHHPCFCISPIPVWRPGLTSGCSLGNSLTSSQSFIRVWEISNTSELALNKIPLESKNIPSEGMKQCFCCLRTTAVTFRPTDFWVQRTSQEHGFRSTFYSFYSWRMWDWCVCPSQRFQPSQLDHFLYFCIDTDPLVKLLYLQVIHHQIQFDRVIHSDDVSLPPLTFFSSTYLSLFRKNT